VATLTFRSLVLWVLGYPEASLADTYRALKDARAIGQAATLMYALHVPFPCIQCGNYVRAKALTDELVTLANEKGALFWKALGMMNQACVLTLTGKAPDAIQMFTSGIAAYLSTGARIWRPLHLLYLARAYAELGQFDDAWAPKASPSEPLLSGRKCTTKATLRP
jgi:hypothetical protein